MKKRRAFIYFSILLLVLTMLSACSSDPVKYTLDISQEGEGTVKPAVGKHEIIKDTIVSLSADPAEGYQFEGWAGPDMSKISEENRILMNKDMEITAVFKKIEKAAEVQLSVEAGTYTGVQQLELSSSTEGAEIRYTTDGSDPTAESVNIYSEAITLIKDTTVKSVSIKDGMIASDIISADYVINYNLTTKINKAGAGNIKVEAAKDYYKYGDSVKLTAGANSGYDFSSWSGDLTGSTNPETLTIDSNKSVTANFTALNMVSDPAISLAGGSYTGAQSVTITTATADAEIYYTTDVSIPTAAAGTLYSGAITINDDTTLKAVAVKAGMNNSNIVSEEYVINYSLTLAADPADGGSITTDPDKTAYKYNETVELTAAANTGYEFSSWSGDLTGSTNPETLTMDANKSVTANFTVKDFVNGDGSEGNPYQITNWYQLAKINSTDSPIGAAYLELNYILMNDLDEGTPGYEEHAGSSANDGKGWVPIGYNQGYFTGVFNGNGHSINNLTINSSNQTYVGFFSTSRGQIKNLNLINVDIEGLNYVGGITGSNYAANNTEGIIKNIYLSGEINANDWVGGITGLNINGSLKNVHTDVTIIANSKIGGLIGYNDTSGLIEESSSKAVINGAENLGGLSGRDYNLKIFRSYAEVDIYGSSKYAGGLTGWSNNASIEESYSLGEISNTFYAGGISGDLNSSSIKNSYSLVNINSTSYAGGIGGDIAYSEVIDSYSAGNISADSIVGGLAGSAYDKNGGSSYWDRYNSNQDTSPIGTGYTTSQMTKENSFSEWNFTNIWQIDENYSYPYLINNKQNPGPVPVTDE